MRSDTDRFEIYIKTTLYSNILLAPLIALGAITSTDRLGWKAVPVAAAAIAHILFCGRLMRAGIAATPKDAPFPIRPALAGGASGVVTIAIAIVAYPQAVPGRESVAVAALMLSVTIYAIALTTVVRSTIVLSTVGFAGCVAVAALSHAQTHAGPGPAVALAGILFFLVPGARVTLWTLSLVRELDKARRDQANLAVAEERLRFSRDLHDVLGRTLSVVALKAELSARLAQRGRPEAADEMLEVRRIAQNSLSDLRGVIAGYRAADLSGELAGARALLESAGISCDVQSDDHPLPAAVQAALAWVVREGTTNVLRHSEARICRITLSVTTGEATLTMENDGLPLPTSGGAFDAEVVRGIGLTGLAERVGALGGSVSAVRVEPDGFRLRARAPLDAHGEAT
ncbi:sensor histidine kinase [Actinoplanes solisilvae]|uniref:sensor histidine kinase n=1 Tax=Actinoplanes solisilvae TaxID=2486853 RepID=UPI000FD922D8|nr:histidine kinase [Actinoplanes solisilvae]